MELRHLVSFITLSEELHFGRAAERLHLSQPSLSAQLQKMEKSLGVQLVVRSSREVQLTAAGRELERHGRQILALVERTTLSVKAVADGSAGTINIGYNLPASRHILPESLAQMAARHPDVMVSMWEKRTGPQLSGVVDGSLDVALVYGRPTISGLTSRRVLKDIPIVAVIGPQHRWAARRSVPFAEFRGQDCVLFDRSQCPAMYDTIVRSASIAKVDLRVTRHADDPGATAHIVASRSIVGFASLPRLIAMRTGSLSNVIAGVKLSDPIPALDLYMVWRSRDCSPSLAKFLSCVSDVGDSGLSYQTPNG